MKAMKPFLFVCLVSLVVVATATAEEQTGQTTMPGPATTYQAKFP